MLEAHAEPRAQRTRAADRPSSSRSRSLDDLARLTPDELRALYLRGTVPGALAVLDGDLVGRMLAVRGAGRGVALRALAAVAGSPGFVWGGKSFHAVDAATGKGINRVRLAGRHRLFPFRTLFGPSVIDGGPCVILDYDDPDNPGFIRAIHDEVREVDPGLYLGPACWKREGRTPLVVLWFALDARGLVNHEPRAPEGRTGLARDVAP
jgi:hypothetical protein